MYTLRHFKVWHVVVAASHANLKTALRDISLLLDIHNFKKAIQNTCAFQSTNETNFFLRIMGKCVNMNA